MKRRLRRGMWWGGGFAAIALASLFSVGYLQSMDPGRDGRYDEMFERGVAHDHALVQSLIMTAFLGMPLVLFCFTAAYGWVVISDSIRLRRGQDIDSG